MYTDTNLQGSRFGLQGFSLRKDVSYLYKSRLRQRYT
jgi:hypothetical protein